MMADTWVTGLAFAPVPDVWRPSLASGFGAVLELPLGETDRDTAAMYRATRHGKPTVNGYSGYEPLHYIALRIALDDGDAAVLDAVAGGQPLLVAVDTGADEDGGWRALVRRHPGAVALGEEGRWAFFGVTPAPRRRVSRATARGCPSSGPPTARAPSPCRRSSIGLALTYWITPGPQRAGDTLTLDLGATSRPTCVALSLGRFVDQYPRELEVDTSLDGVTWTPGFRGSGAALTVTAALEHPAEITLAIGLEPRQARFIRLRATQSETFYPWLIGGVVVRGETIAGAPPAG